MRDGEPGGMHNEHGQVNDPEIARAMADTELEYGSTTAEVVGTHLYNERLAEKFLDEAEIEDTDDGWRISGTFEGKALVVRYKHESHGNELWLEECTIDGKDASRTSRADIDLAMKNQIQKKFEMEVI